MAPATSKACNDSFRADVGRYRRYHFDSDERERMPQPTTDEVRQLVTKAAKKHHVNQADIARMLGVTASSLKKNMADGATHRNINSPTYQMLQLLAGEHPHWKMTNRSKE